MSVEPIALNQRMIALSTANRIRIYRAELKRNIGKVERTEGLRMVADILDTPPNDDLRTMLVKDLVDAVALVGPVRARQLLRGERETTLANMTERERAKLAQTLRSAA